MEPGHDNAAATSPSDDVGADVLQFTTGAPVESGYQIPSSREVDNIAGVKVPGELGSFLNRPVRIYTFNWSTAAVGNHIDPWVLFLSDSALRNKISNYMYLRGDLHLEIEVNGTPFHYGQLMVSYEPALYDKLSVDGREREHSSLSHVVIDPSISNVARLVCPFISPHNYIDLTDANPSLGVLNFDAIVDLLSASGTVDVITVHVYAWMENVTLVFPTEAPLATYVAQSGTHGEEVVQASTGGVISSGAKSLAKYAGYLSTVPVIGPYAIATETFSNAVGDFASFFGFSRPRDITTPNQIVVSSGGNMSNVDVPDNSTTLALHARQELTIDPGVYGYACDEDEMSVASIVGRWGLAGVWAWDVADTEGAILAEFHVNPANGSVAQNGAPGDRILDMLPVGMVSHAFSYWRGTMEYRIEICCSKFHRGRLRVQWQPGNTAGSLTSTNTTLNHVIDVSEHKTTVFQVPHSNSNGYLQTLNFNTTNDGNTGTSATCNGTLRLRVQNQLVSPEATSAAYIVVWVRGGHDLNFSEPNQRIANTSLYTFQSGTHDETAFASRDTEILAFFEGDTSPGVYMTYYGDPVPSFRLLSKRYVAYAPLFWPSAAGGSTANTTILPSLSIPHFPKIPGEYANASHSKVATGAVSLTANTVMGYLAPCFLATRGSMRYKFQLSNSEDRQGYWSVYRAETPGRISGSCSTLSGGHTAANASALFDNTALSLPFSNGCGGMQLFPNAQANGRLIEVESPYYHPLKFHSTSVFWGSYTSERGIALTGRFTNSRATTNDIQDVGGAAFVAAGEDFSLSVWRGVPRMISNPVSGGRYVIDGYEGVVQGPTNLSPA